MPNLPAHPTALPAPGTAPVHVLARSPTWVVVAKPPGLFVHRTSLARAGSFLLQRVRNHLGRRVHPVHRLDRPTSGCVLFALEREAIPDLQSALSSGTKTYLAFVRGEWTRGTEVLTITRPLRDDRGVLRDATSRVECLGTSADPRCSLVRVEPSTGRTHQIRRHLRGIDHPILGDATHGDTRANRAWRASHGFPRLGLHCARLELSHPSIEPIHAHCPLFDDLHAVWHRMPWWSTATEREPSLAHPPLPLDAPRAPNPP